MGVPTGYTLKPNIIRLGSQEIRIAVPCSTLPVLYRAMFSPDVLRASPQCEGIPAVAWVFQRNVVVPVSAPGQSKVELRVGIPFYEGYRTSILPLPPWLKLAYVPYVPREALVRVPVWGWVLVFKIDYAKLVSS